MARLQALAGVWRGSGVSHDGEPFLAICEVRSALAGRGVSLSFEARAENKQLLHAEEVCCFPGPTPADPCGAVSVGSEAPPLVLAEDATAPDGRIAFATGPACGPEGLRLVKWLATDPDGDLVLGWAWGMGDEPIAERSRATLMRG